MILMISIDLTASYSNPSHISTQNIIFIKLFHYYSRISVPQLITKNLGINLLHKDLKASNLSLNC